MNKIPDMLHTVSFIGIYNNNSQYKTGDLVIKNGEPYVYMNNHWESIDFNEDLNKEMIPSRCPNCGAPLDLNAFRCQYCDSMFMKRVAMKA